MNIILEYITPQILIVLLLNFTLFFILLILYISLRAKFKKLKSKYTKFMNGLSDKNIEDILENCIDNINCVKEKNREIENHINYIERNLIQCIQKVGVIRFNAFENVGSDLSYCVALLDNNDSGVIITGLYSRDSSSTYAKPIVNGKSKYTLSAEELQAFDLAKKSHGERIYMSK